MEKFFWDDLGQQKNQTKLLVSRFRNISSKNGASTNFFGVEEVLHQNFRKLKTTGSRDPCLDSGLLSDPVLRHIPSGNLLHNELERFTMLFMGNFTISTGTCSIAIC